MRIGLVKTSLVDFPAEVAAALFIRGCNLRCPYCHNPELVLGPEPPGLLDPEEVLAFLHRRKNVLGGVCVSGGEPLLHPELPEFLREIRHLGLKVKLDTTGTLPEALGRIEADYIAMDLKTVPEKYGLLAGPAACLPAAGPGSAPPRNGRCPAEAHAAAGLPAGPAARTDAAAPGADGLAAAVRESAALIIDRGGDHEFRTTAAPGIFDPRDIPAMAEILRGAKRHILAPYRGEKTLDRDYGKNAIPCTMEELLAFRREFRVRGVDCDLRGISGEGT